MTPFDLAVRNATYATYIELGRAPTIHEIAVRVDESPDDVADAWRRLHDGHALVLDQAGAILMLNPFSAVDTPHRVEAGGRTWFGNCGWDAFGIGAALHADSTIHTTCPDCGEPVDLDVRNRVPTDQTPVFHVLMPAREWWNDIRFT